MPVEKSEGIRINQTLQAVHVAADMILAGKDICLQSLKQYPFIPHFLILAQTVRENSEFDSLSPAQRNDIAVNGARDVYSMLESRAELQKKWSINPIQGKYNIVERIQDEMGIEIDPDDVELRWSLFSFAVVAKKKAYDVIRKAFGVSNKAAGFVPRIVSEIGLVPVCLSGPDIKTTLWHEDIHAFQFLLGELDVPFNFSDAMEDPDLMRIFENEDIRSGDVEKAKNLFKGVCANAQREVGIELRAYVWEKRKPQTSLDDERQQLLIANDILNNAIHSSGSPLTDEEKVRETFRTILSVGEVDHYRNVLWAVVKQAVAQHPGQKNVWDWVASRLTVLPVHSSIPMVKAVLLGRGEKLLNEPKLDQAIPLPQALITLVRRKINPGSYGQGEMIPKERVEEFWETAAAIFNDTALYRQIIIDYGITGEQMVEVKKKFLIYAQKSVPAGFRGRTEKEMGQRLNLQQVLSDLNF